MSKKKLVSIEVSVQEPVLHSKMAVLLVVLLLKTGKSRIKFFFFSVL